MPRHFGIAGVYEVGAGFVEQGIQFAGPEEDVEETAALQVFKILLGEADAQRGVRKLVDFGHALGQLDRAIRNAARARIEFIELLIALRNEVIQTESLRAQNSSRGLCTAIQLTMNIQTIRNHFSQAQLSKFISEPCYWGRALRSSGSTEATPLH
jgi:hypothetical protein